MLQSLFFYIFSLGVLAFGLGVILSRSAIYSVLSLVMAMGCLAGLFVLLKAFLVATILVLVYAGAILVLFLFVVMLIDFKKVPAGPVKPTLSAILAVAVGAIFFIQTWKVLKSLPPAASAPPVQGTTQAIGKVLFGQYVLPFELTAFLILAGVVSVVVLAKKDEI